MSRTKSIATKGYGRVRRTLGRRGEIILAGLVPPLTRWVMTEFETRFLVCRSGSKRHIPCAPAEEQFSPPRSHLYPLRSAPGKHFDLRLRFH
jgi:hypothetical protein